MVVDLFDKQRKAVVSHKPKDNKRDIIIGIDAGHGGEDPGSISQTGVYEKKITLAIAKRLKDIIDREPGLKGELIRTGD